jgi:hypothetical protein
MKWAQKWLWLMLLVLAAEAAPAQQPGSAVQLPTYSSFSVGTTVVVPDRGSALLGGIGRASSSRSEAGVPLLPLRLFRNSAISAERSASGASITVTIHDFAAMDEFLLGQAGAQQPLPVVPPRAIAMGNLPRPPSAPASPSWRLKPPAGAEGPEPMSVADARAEREKQQAARQDEAANFFARGRQAEAEGKRNVARIYYQMAARSASGELKQQVLARLAALGGAAAPAVAQTAP